MPSSGRRASPSAAARLVKRHSRASIASASRSMSTKGSPLTSTATRLMVPPMKPYGASPG